jgi:aspartyl aminopeptidase
MTEMTTRRAVPFFISFSFSNNTQEAGNGLNIVGCHTDSPNLKVMTMSRGTMHHRRKLFSLKQLKPVVQSEREGYVSVNVETYGGGLWSTWFDRDLTVAGRIIVDNNGSFESRLVNIGR